MLPEDKNQQATRGDIERLDINIKRLDYRIDSLEHKLDSFAAETKAQLSRITATLDSFVGEARDNKRTLLVYDKILAEHRISLENHEKRLAGLEGHA